MSDHTIILVRLEPTCSADMVDSTKYPNVTQVTQHLNTRPFLGLCVWSFTLDPKITLHRHIIYPISTVPFKGPGPAHLRCFSLLPPLEGDTSNIPSLSVVPPFPDEFCRQLRAEGKNLYLNLTPELNVQQFLPWPEESDIVEDTDEPPEVPGKTQYRLTEDSFDRFRTAMREAAYEWVRAAATEDREAAPPVPSREAVLNPEWRMIGTPRRPEGDHSLSRSYFVFESPLAVGGPSIDPLELALDETIELDIGLYQQILDDVYAACAVNQNTITRTISWRKQIPAAPAMGPTPPQTPSHRGDGHLPTLSGPLLAAVKTIHSRLLPRDRDPNGEYEEGVSGANKPHEAFPSLPWTYKPVPFQAEHVKVVAFDIFGAILDIQSANVDHMQPLCPYSPYRYTAESLAIRYESIEVHTAREWSSSDGPLTFQTLVERAMSKLLEIYVVTLPDPELLDKILQDMVKTPGKAYTDVIPSLTALCRQSNFRLVCMHPGDPDICAALHRAVPNGLLSSFSAGYELQGMHLQNPVLFSELLAHCNTLVPGITSGQILVVTTGGARQVEIANGQGFQTVLLQRPGNHEAAVPLTGPITKGPQSLKLKTLEDLCERLGVACI